MPRKSYYPSAPIVAKQEVKPPSAEGMALLERCRAVQSRLHDLTAQRAAVDSEIRDVERYLSLLDALEQQDDVLAALATNQAGK